MDPIFTEIINADTSAESIFRDRLQALDQWMKDPILDPLSEVYQFLQGRVGSSGASGMSGDAVDVTDEDWTETAVFVERMLSFLYPARRPSRDVTRDRLVDVSDKIADFMGMTDTAQRAKLEERIERQVSQLQTLTAQLKSKQIKIPNWLNVNKLEQNLKKEANSKAKELAKRWASKKQKGADEHEQAVIAEEESSGHVAVEEPDCLPGDAKVEAEEARDRRENIREDAQARGENADQALKEDDARTQNETTKTEEAGGGTCGGGGAGGCAGQTNPCECAPEPTEAEKNLPVEPQLETYVVLKGDWLSKIAKEKLGDAGRWRDLYELNKAVIDKDNLKRRGNTDKSFNWIYPGQILTLPPSEVQPETDDNPELAEAQQDVDDTAEADPGEECVCEDGELGVDGNQEADALTDTGSGSVQEPTETTIQVPYTVKYTEPVTVTKTRAVKKTRPVTLTKTRKVKHRDVVMVSQQVGVETKVTEVKLPIYRTQSTPIFETRKRVIPPMVPTAVQVSGTQKKTTPSVRTETKPRKIKKYNLVTRTEMEPGDPVPVEKPYTHTWTEDVVRYEKRWLQGSGGEPRKKTAEVDSSTTEGSTEQTVKVLPSEPVSPEALEALAEDGTGTVPEGAEGAVSAEDDARGGVAMIGDPVDADGVKWEFYWVKMVEPVERSEVRNEIVMEPGELVPRVYTETQSYWESEDGTITHIEDEESTEEGVEEQLVDPGPDGKVVEEVVQVGWSTEIIDTGEFSVTSYSTEIPVFEDVPKVTEYELDETYTEEVIEEYEEEETYEVEELQEFEETCWREVTVIEGGTTPASVEQDTSEPNPQIGGGETSEGESEQVNLQETLQVFEEQASEQEASRLGEQQQVSEVLEQEQEAQSKSLEQEQAEEDSLRQDAVAQIETAAVTASEDGATVERAVDTAQLQEDTTVGSEERTDDNAGSAVAAAATQDPQSTGVDYSGLESLIAQVTSTRSDFLTRYENARFAGSALLLTDLSEALEASHADLNESRSLALESVKNRYEPILIGLEKESKDAQNRANSLSGGAEGEYDRALKQFTTLNEKYIQTEQGHTQAMRVHDENLRTEFDQLDDLKSIIDSGGDPVDLQSPEAAKAAAARVDTSVGVEVWVQSFLQRLRTEVWGEFSSRYESARFAGSVLLLQNLGKDLDKKISQYKKERSLVEKKYTDEREEKTGKPLSALSQDIGKSELDERVLRAKSLYKSSPLCMGFIDQYSGRISKDSEDQGTKKAANQKLSIDVERTNLAQKAAVEGQIESSGIDIDFEFTQLDDLKGAIESGGHIERTEAAALELGDSVEALKVWLDTSTLLSRIRKVWTEGEKEHQATKFSGSVLATTEVVRRLKKSTDRLKFEHEKSNQHFEALLSREEAELDLQERALGDAEGENTQLKTKQKQCETLTKALTDRADEHQDAFDDLEALKSAIESGEGPTAGAKAMGPAAESSGTYKEWAGKFIIEVDGTLKTLNKSYQVMKSSGSAAGLRKLEQKVEQQSAGLAKGKERASKVFTERFDQIINRFVGDAKQKENKIHVPKWAVESPYDGTPFEVLESDTSADVERKQAEFKQRKTDVEQSMGEDIKVELDKLSKLKSSISTGKSASSATEADLFSAGDLSKMSADSYAKSSDVLGWANGMVEVLQKLQPFFRKRYEVARTSGSDAVLEKFTEEFNLQYDALSNKIGKISSFTLNGFNEDADARAAHEKEHKEKRRAADKMVKAAFRPIEQLKSDIDSGIVAGSASEVAAIDLSLEAGDYPEWLDKLRVHLNAFRLKQLKHYRDVVQFSGSVASCKKMGLRLTQQVRSYRIEDEQKKQFFDDTAEHEMGFLTRLKAELKKKEVIEEKKYKGTWAEAFARPLEENNHKKRINEIENAEEEHKSIRDRRVSPLKRVVDAELSLIEQLAAVVAEGKPARAKLERTPKAGEIPPPSREDAAAPKTDGVLLGAGNWRVEITEKNASDDQRYTVSRAEEGSGTHDGNSPGQFVEVKSVQGWRLLVEHSSGQGWGGSTLSLTDKAPGSQLQAKSDTERDTSDLVLDVMPLGVQASVGSTTGVSSDPAFEDKAARLRDTLKKQVGLKPRDQEVFSTENLEAIEDKKKVSPKMKKGMGRRLDLESVVAIGQKTGQVAKRFRELGNKQIARQVRKTLGVEIEGYAEEMVGADKTRTLKKATGGDLMSEPPVKNLKLSGEAATATVKLRWNLALHDIDALSEKIADASTPISELQDEAEMLREAFGLKSLKVEEEDGKRRLKAALNPTAEEEFELDVQDAIKVLAKQREDTGETVETLLENPHIKDDLERLRNNQPTQTKLGATLARRIAHASEKRTTEELKKKLAELGFSEEETKKLVGDAAWKAQQRVRKNIGDTSDYIDKDETEAHLLKFRTKVKNDRTNVKYDRLAKRFFNLGAHAFITPELNSKIHKSSEKGGFGGWGRDSMNGNFVAPKQTADGIVKQAKSPRGEGIRTVEQKLGITKDSWNNEDKTLFRYYVPDPNEFGIHIATGREDGAYGKEWFAGGKTEGGYDEAVIGAIRGEDLKSAERRGSLLITKEKFPNTPAKDVSTKSSDGGSGAGGQSPNTENPSIIAKRSKVSRPFPAPARLPAPQGKREPFNPTLGSIREEDSESTKLAVEQPPDVKHLDISGTPATDAIRRQWEAALPALDGLAQSMENSKQSLEALNKSARQVKDEHGLKSVEIQEDVGEDQKTTRGLHAKLNPEGESEAVVDTRNSLRKQTQTWDKLGHRGDLERVMRGEKTESRLGTTLLRRMAHNRGEAVKDKKRAVYSLAGVQDIEKYTSDHWSSLTKAGTDAEDGLRQYMGDPNSYMQTSDGLRSKGAVDQHLSHFYAGGHAFITPFLHNKFHTEKGFKGWGRDYNFIAPKSEADSLVVEAMVGEGITTIEKNLGIPRDQWNNTEKTLYRYHVVNPQEVGLHMATGKESGAYGKEWIAGGYALDEKADDLRGGREARIDRFDLSSLRDQEREGNIRIWKVKFPNTPDPKPKSKKPGNETDAAEQSAEYDNLEVSGSAATDAIRSQWEAALPDLDALAKLMNDSSLSLAKLNERAQEVQDQHGLKAVEIQEEMGDDQKVTRRLFANLNPEVESTTLGLDLDGDKASVETAPSQTELRDNPVASLSERFRTNAAQAQSLIDEARSMKVQFDDDVTEIKASRELWRNSALKMGLSDYFQTLDEGFDELTSDQFADTLNANIASLIAAASVVFTKHTQATALIQTGSPEMEPRLSVLLDQVHDQIVVLNKIYYQVNIQPFKARTALAEGQKYDLSKDGQDEQIQRRADRLIDSTRAELQAYLEDKLGVGKVSIWRSRALKAFKSQIKKETAKHASGKQKDAIAQDESLTDKQATKAYLLLKAEETSVKDVSDVVKLALQRIADRGTDQITDSIRTKIIQSVSQAVSDVNEAPNSTQDLQTVMDQHFKDSWSQKAVAETAKSMARNWKNGAVKADKLLKKLDNFRDSELPDKITKEDITREALSEVERSDKGAALAARSIKAATTEEGLSFMGHMIDSALSNIGRSVKLSLKLEIPIPDTPFTVNIAFSGTAARGIQGAFTEGVPEVGSDNWYEVSGDFTLGAGITVLVAKGSIGMMFATRAGAHGLDKAMNALWYAGYQKARSLSSGFGSWWGGSYGSKKESKAYKAESRAAAIEEMVFKSDTQAYADLVVAGSAGLEVDIVPGATAASVNYSEGVLQHYDDETIRKLLKANGKDADGKPATQYAKPLLNDSATQGNTDPLSETELQKIKYEKNKAARDRRYKMSKVDESDLVIFKLSVKLFGYEFALTYSRAGEDTWGVEVAAALPEHWVSSQTQSLITGIIEALQRLQNAHERLKSDKKDKKGAGQQAGIGFVEAVTLSSSSIEQEFSSLKLDEASAGGSLQIALLIGSQGGKITTLRGELRSVQKISIAPGLGFEFEAERTQRLAYFGTQVEADGQRHQVVGFGNISRNHTNEPAPIAPPKDKLSDRDAKSNANARGPGRTGQNPATGSTESRRPPSASVNSSSGSSATSVESESIRRNKVERHEALADSVARELQSATAPGTDRSDQARVYEEGVTEMLEPNVELSVTLTEASVEDGPTKAEIRISPNDTVIQTTLPAQNETVDSSTRVPKSEFSDPLRWYNDYRKALRWSRKNAGMYVRKPAKFEKAKRSLQLLAAGIHGWDHLFGTYNALKNAGVPPGSPEMKALSYQIELLTVELNSRMSTAQVEVDSYRPITTSKELHKPMKQASDRLSEQIARKRQSMEQVLLQFRASDNTWLHPAAADLSPENWKQNWHSAVLVCGVSTSDNGFADALIRCAEHRSSAGMTSPHNRIRRLAELEQLLMVDEGLALIGSLSHQAEKWPTLVQYLDQVIAALRAEKDELLASLNESSWTNPVGDIHALDPRDPDSHALWRQFMSGAQEQGFIYDAEQDFQVGDAILKLQGLFAAVQSEVDVRARSLLQAEIKTTLVTWRKGLADIESFNANTHSEVYRYTLEFVQVLRKSNVLIAELFNFVAQVMDSPRGDAVDRTSVRPSASDSGQEAVQAQALLTLEQKEELETFKQLQGRENVRRELRDPFAELVAHSALDDKMGARKSLDPIENKADEDEILVHFTNKLIRKSIKKTATLRGSKLFYKELTRVVRKRGLDLEEGSSPGDRSPETVSELRHLNVSLDPRLLSKVDERLSGSSESSTTSQPGVSETESEQSVGSGAALSREEGGDRADDLELEAPPENGVSLDAASSEDPLAQFSAPERVTEEGAATTWPQIIVEPPPVTPQPEPTAITGGSVSAVAEQGLALTPTALAASKKQIDMALGAEFTGQQDSLRGDLPDITAKMSGRKVPSKKKISTQLSAQPLSDGVQGTTPSNPRLPRRSRTSSLPPGPGRAPRIPLGGKTDPARLDRQRQQAASSVSGASQKSRAAIMSGKGPEQIQPKRLKRRNPIPLQAVSLPEAPPIGPFQEYLDLGLPGDVQTAFDTLHGPALNQRLAGARQDIGTAEQGAMQDQETAIKGAQDEIDVANRQAQKDQEAKVASLRGQIETQRSETLKDQAQLSKQFNQQAEGRQKSELATVQKKISETQRTVDSRFAATDRTTTQLKKDANRKAATERRKIAAAEKADQDKGYLESAYDYVSDAVSAVIDAVSRTISSIFSAISNQITNAINATLDFANQLITSATAFVQNALTTFHGWLKAGLEELLSKHFPELLETLNRFVDRAFATVSTFIDNVAAGLKKAAAATAAAVSKTLNTIVDAFETVITTALTVIDSIVQMDFRKLGMMVLEAALSLAGIAKEEFIQIFGRADEVLDALVENPGGFVLNLIGALKQGFTDFQDGFPEHLKNGMVGWLTGAMGNIKMPKTLDMAGIFSVGAQAMGWTKEYIQGKVAKLFGQENPRLVAKIWDVLESAMANGWEGLWQDHVAPFIDNLQSDIVSGITDWLKVRVVKAAIIKIASMFNPVGALVQVLMTSWNIFGFLRDSFSQMVGMANSVVNSVHDIAMGKLDGAAQGITGVLAKMLPLGLDLLARVVGIGRAADAVQDTMGKLRKKVDAGIDMAIMKVRGRFNFGRKKKERQEKRKQAKMTAPGEHSVAIPVAPKPILASDPSRGFKQVTTSGVGHVSPDGKGSTVNRGEASEALNHGLTDAVGRLSLKGGAKGLKAKLPEVAAETRKRANRKLKRKDMAVDHVEIKEYSVPESADEKLERKAAETKKKFKDATTGKAQEKLKALQGKADKIGEKNYQRAKAGAKNTMDAVTGKGKKAKATDSEAEKESAKEAKKGVDASKLPGSHVITQAGVMHVGWDAKKGTTTAEMTIAKTFAGLLRKTAIPTMERQATSLTAPDKKQIATTRLRGAKAAAMSAESKAIRYLEGGDNLESIRGSVNNLSAALLDIGDAIGGPLPVRLQDGEIGETVQFKAAGEAHKIWVEAGKSGASIHVASTPRPVGDWLNEWIHKVPGLPEDSQLTARSLIKSASAKLNIAGPIAQRLSEQVHSGRAIDNPAKMEASDARLESEEQSLAAIVAQLFNIFGDGGSEQYTKSIYALIGTQVCSRNSGGADSLILRQVDGYRIFLREGSAQIQRLKKSDALPQVHIDEAGVLREGSSTEPLPGVEKYVEVKHAGPPMVEIYGFRGARDVDGVKFKSLPDSDPRKKEWDDVYLKEHLLIAGHVGISVDGGQTIYGLTPEIPEDMTPKQAGEALYDHKATFPGRVADDTHIFKLADKYSREKKWNTSVTAWKRPVARKVQAQLLWDLQRLSGMKAGEHGIYYSFPLKNAQEGEFFIDSPSVNGRLIKGENQSNCATLPRFVGVSLPEQSGNLRYYIPELEKKAKG